MPSHEWLRRIKRQQRYREAKQYLGDRCNRCDVLDRCEVLVFHHIDKSTKLFNIAGGLTRSENIFWDEVDKCELLCEKCHKAEHEPAHGTQSRYCGGCSCFLCRDAMNKANKERIKRKKEREGLI